MILSESSQKFALISTKCVIKKMFLNVSQPILDVPCINPFSNHWLPYSFRQIYMVHLSLVRIF